MVEFNKIDDAIDIIFHYANDSFTRGDFKSVNDSILMFDCERLGIAVCLSLLTVCHWSDKLNNYNEFYKRVKDYIFLADPERCDRLLKGFNR